MTSHSRVGSAPFRRSSARIARTIAGTAVMSCVIPGTPALTAPGTIVMARSIQKPRQSTSPAKQWPASWRRTSNAARPAEGPNALHAMGARLPLASRSPTRTSPSPCRCSSVFRARWSASRPASSAATGNSIVSASVMIPPPRSSPRRRRILPAWRKRPLRQGAHGAVAVIDAQPFVAPTISVAANAWSRSPTRVMLRSVVAVI